MPLRVLLVATALLLVLAAPAFATAPTASQITSPTDPTYLVNDLTTGTSITVNGTTSGGDGTGAVDLLCYYAATSKQLALNVHVANDAFTYTGAPTGIQFHTCVLRAVPAGTTPAAAPGSASPFEGPRLAVGNFTTYNFASGLNVGKLYSYYVYAPQLQGAFDYDTASSCGLDDSYPYSDLTTFAPQAGVYLFYCNAYFYNSNKAATPGTRSELQVDGVNAYGPDSAKNLNSGTIMNNPGFPALTVSYSLDPITGDLTIHETDEIVKCSPSTDFQSTPTGYATSCTSFDKLPVTLERTIVQDHLGRVTRIADKWASSDNAAHDIDVLYQNDNYQATGAGALNFSWTADGYRGYADGETIAGPATAPGTIFVKRNGAAADGDPLNPTGVIAFSSPPDSAIFTRGTTGGAVNVNVFELNYKRQIPACGSLNLHFGYGNAYFQSDVDMQANDLRAAFASVSEKNTEGCEQPSANPTSNPSSDTTQTPASTPQLPPRDTTPPILGVTVAAQKLGKVIAKGLTEIVSCNEACSIASALTVDAKTAKKLHIARTLVVGRAKATLTAAGKTTLKVKLSRKAQKALKKASKVKLTLRTTAKDAAGNVRTVTKRVTLKR